MCVDQQHTEGSLVKVTLTQPMDKLILAEVTAVGWISVPQNLCQPGTSECDSVWK